VLDRLVGKPEARVLVIDLRSGDHTCYDMRSGSYVVVELEGEEAPLMRLSGRAALRRTISRLRRELAESRAGLEVELLATRAIVDRQRQVLAAVLEASTLEEAKARALWAANPVV
jgi:hypothetical protein